MPHDKKGTNPISKDKIGKLKSYKGSKKGSKATHKQGKEEKMRFSVGNFVFFNTQAKLAPDLSDLTCVIIKLGT